MRILDLNLNDAEAVTQEIASARQAKQNRHSCQQCRHPQIGNVEATPEDAFDRIIRVNVKGYYNCIYVCIGHVKAQGGVILNIASIAGSVGVADRFGYSTRKGAIIAMTYSVARDYLAHNIRCNCISPARVHTPFVDGYLKKLSRSRKGNVRQAGKNPAHRAHGQTGRGCLASIILVSA